MFNIKKAFLVVVALSLTIGSLRCQSGSAFYSFLDIPSSAKIYGLGGVNISTVDAGIESTRQNPALLGPEYRHDVGISYMRYFGDSNFGSLAYGNAIGEHSAWGAAVSFLSYGSIQETDVEGSVLGDFSPIDVVASVAYSRDINTVLRGGAALKAIYSAYGDYNSFALAVDLGINYYDADRDLSLSATIINLGGQLKRFDQTYERLPIDVRLGWTQSFPTLPIRFSITAWNLTKWRVPYPSFDQNDATIVYENSGSFFNNLFRHLVFSADLMPSEHYYVTLGYNYKTRTDMSSYYRNFLSGFYLGAGVNVNRWAFSLAYAQPHKGGNTFMVNISTTLGKLLN